MDLDITHQTDQDGNSEDIQKTYTVEEFEVRILEPEKSGGQWETKASIPMQNFENALTVRVVTLSVSTKVICWRDLHYCTQ